MKADKFATMPWCTLARWSMRLRATSWWEDFLFYYRSASNTEVDFLALPERKVAESKYVETSDRRELRAMQENFGEGLLLTRSAVDIQANGTILPVSIFCWLLDQGE